MRIYIYNIENYWKIYIYIYYYLFSCNSHETLSLPLGSSGPAKSSQRRKSCRRLMPNDMQRAMVTSLRPMWWILDKRCQLWHFFCGSCMIRCTECPSSWNGNITTSWNPAFSAFWTPCWTKYWTTCKRDWWTRCNVVFNIYEQMHQQLLYSWD